MLLKALLEVLDKAGGMAVEVSDVGSPTRQGCRVLMVVERRAKGAAGSR
jgi:hypothetical protein